MASAHGAGAAASQIFAVVLFGSVFLCVAGSMAVIPASLQSCMRINLHVSAARCDPIVMVWDYSALSLCLGVGCRCRLQFEIVETTLFGKL